MVLKCVLLAIDGEFLQILICMVSHMLRKLLTYIAIRMLNWQNLQQYQQLAGPSMSHSMATYIPHHASHINTRTNHQQYLFVLQPTFMSTDLSNRNIYIVCHLTQFFNPLQNSTTLYCVYSQLVK